jgi:hypothetical protein
MASQDPGFKNILYLHLPAYKEVINSFVGMRFLNAITKTLTLILLMWRIW